jgi:medium-chain acyl-[acyl-carrier-protein] hydrolase
LFCLPHAGGGAGVYRHWAARLAPSIEVVAVQPPGRESRRREAPYAKTSELVGDLLAAVEPLLDRPHCWFGHSMGALIAFEVCRALHCRPVPQPARLVVSGRPAPHLADRNDPIHQASDADLARRLRELGGTPPEVLADAELLSSMLPVVRADLTMVAAYRCAPRPPLDCPITVFGGTDDRFVSTGELHAWQEHSTARSTVRTFDGGHFYLHQQAERFLPVLAADLMAAVPARRATDGWATPAQTGRKPWSE